MKKNGDDSKGNWNFDYKILYMKWSVTYFTETAFSYIVAKTLFQSLYFLKNNKSNKLTCSLQWHEKTIYYNQFGKGVLKHPKINKKHSPFYLICKSIRIKVIIMHDHFS